MLLPNDILMYFFFPILNNVQEELGNQKQNSAFILQKFSSADERIKVNATTRG